MTLLAETIRRLTGVRRAPRLPRDIVALHREGLERVARVIDGSPHYDVLHAYKLTDEDIARFGPEIGPSERRDQAIARAQRHLIERQGRLVQPAFSGFACDGTSRNNLSEFAFFERICAPLEITIAEKNYASAPRGGFSKTDRTRRDALLEPLLGDIRSFYEERSSITAGLVRQQMYYSKAFLQNVLSFTKEGAALPAALVQANDHSPSRVALSMTIKGLGVPRIYLQHAEVSGAFPPLDFEYAVLRNRRSLAVYKDIGPITARVFVISRDASVPPLDALAARRDEGVTVVVYPTSRVRMAELGRLVSSLRRNAGVSEILIKQHPGAIKLLDRAQVGEGVSFVETFPSRDHVAIVGNSSVAVELLKRGFPVYQNFDFDPVVRDYYGLVRAGVTREISLEDFDGPFWSPYRIDKAWRAAFSEWVPGTGASARDEARFVAAMARLR